MTKTTDETRYLVICFADKSIYKIDLENIIQRLARMLCQDGDIDLTEAFKQVRSTHDDTLITYANSLQWDDIKALAEQVDKSHPVGNYSAEYAASCKYVMGESELSESLIRMYNLRTFAHVS